jgi:hypothetical protein
VKNIVAPASWNFKCATRDLYRIEW